MGSKRPPGVSPVARQVARHIEEAPYEQGADLIVELERNLEALTRGIQEYASINEVPLHYQRHIVGVSARLCQLLG